MARAPPRAPPGLPGLVDGEQRRSVTREKWGGVPETCKLKVSGAPEQRGTSPLVPSARRHQSPAPSKEGAGTTEPHCRPSPGRARGRPEKARPGFLERCARGPDCSFLKVSPIPSPAHGHSLRGAWATADDQAPGVRPSLHSGHLSLVPRPTLPRIETTFPASLPLGGAARRLWPRHVSGNVDGNFRHLP